MLVLAAIYLCPYAQRPLPASGSGPIEDDAHRLMRMLLHSMSLRYARVSVVGGARGRAPTWSALPLMSRFQRPVAILRDGAALCMVLP